MQKEEWLPLPDGRFLSSGLMLKFCLDEEPSMFSLQDVSRKGHARELKIHYEHLGIKFDESDPPIDRLLKVVSMRERDARQRKMLQSQGFTERDWVDLGSYVPTQREYINLILGLLEQKARGEQVDAYLDALMSRGLDATRELIVFRGKDGTRYRAELHRFNHDTCRFEPVEDLKLPQKGYIHAFDVNGYPTETSREFSTLENVPEVEGLNRHGMFYIDGERHKPPVPGEERLVTHYTTRGGSGLFCTYVTFPRSCDSGGIGVLRLKTAA